MRMLMVILTLLFVYPLCPDEVQTTADAGIEVLECGFCEELVEGEVIASRQEKLSRKVVVLKESLTKDFSKVSNISCHHICALDTPLILSDIVHTFQKLRL